LVETSKIEARYRPAGSERESPCVSPGADFRAALFHAGALRGLNELGVLSQVRTVSSVSGGSIASGLLATCGRGSSARGDRFTNLEVLSSNHRAFCGRNIRQRPAALGPVESR
jgi:NTE family protein